MAPPDRGKVASLYSGCFEGKWMADANSRAVVIARDDALDGLFIASAAVDGGVGLRKISRTIGGWLKG